MNAPRPDMGATGIPAPFPWFGGKGLVAAEVWARFGPVRNYVEPFFGAGAVLFARPAPWHGVETVNDLDGFVSNFWRAVQADPAAVAAAVDWPVNERDLEARHYWLVTEGAARLARLAGDPAGHDAQVAGWWCWGLCAWIGGGWCAGDGPWQWTADGWARRPTAGQGVNRQLPHLGNPGRGVNRKLPHLGDAGQGVNRQLPHLGNAGQGVNRQLPHLGDAGQGVNRVVPHRFSLGPRNPSGAGSQVTAADRAAFLAAWFATIADRLRHVRVACGDWARVCTPAVTDLRRNGLNPTGVFLDPPYVPEGHFAAAYRHDGAGLAAAVRDWAAANGDRPDLRIALCGYAGDNAMPAGWTAHRWKSKGGFGSQADGTGRANAARETVWFSPHCLPPGQETLL